MIDKLTEKDIRALKLGAVAAVVILLFYAATQWRDHWAVARTNAAELQAKLDAIDVDKAKQAGLTTIVPAFEMPKVEDEQSFLFRDKLSEQLKRAGINNKPLQVQAGRKSLYPGYNLLLVKCSATCRFPQMLDFLAWLNENPYLVGIEEFKIKVDPKKPQEVELELTVSTFTSLTKKGSGS
ncbi:MAG: hypothetical protein A2Z25_15155 [Planctomycetes bacterium RBG_16_55_9]|nr:MAG: hypothetical protein A2Z25_15155 [Planctomycetes bacterium RBG_16_55_9]